MPTRLGFDPADTLAGRFLASASGAQAALLTLTATVSGMAAAATLAPGMRQLRTKPVPPTAVTHRQEKQGPGTRTGTRSVVFLSGLRQASPA